MNTASDGSYTNSASSFQEYGSIYSKRQVTNTIEDQQGMPTGAVGEKQKKRQTVGTDKKVYLHTEGCPDLRQDGLHLISLQV